MSDDRYADHDAAWHRDMERMVEEEFDRGEAEMLDQYPIDLRAGAEKAEAGPMTCWVPSCPRRHLLMRDAGGWWWCVWHFRSRRFGGWPKEVRW